MTYKDDLLKDQSVSVLLCSYNGEKYIGEQLDSLLEQSCKIDEVLLIDDHSSDSTVQIVDSFIEKHHLSENWKCRVNGKNIGWKMNFVQGVSLCTGKYLFFCDQDDLWDYRKIEKMVTAFREDPEIKVIGCSTIEFFKDGRSIVKGPDDGALRKMDYSSDIHRFLDHPPGCAMAIETAYARELLKDYHEPWAHDDFLWRYAAIQGKAYIYGTPLVFHRVSGDNVFGKGMRTAGIRAKKADYNVRCYEDLLRYLDALEIKDEGLKNVITYHIDGNRIRKSYLKKPNKSDLFALMFRFRKIYTGLKQFCGDLIISHTDL